MRVGQPSVKRRVFQGKTSRVKGLEREPHLLCARGVLGLEMWQAQADKGLLSKRF